MKTFLGEKKTAQTIDEYNSYQYEVLDHQNIQLLIDTADCIAETFTGVQVGGSFIQEPMTKALNLSKETFKVFAQGYLEAVGPQGLTIIAKERETGRVIGTLICEDFNPEEEVPVFEGDLEPFNAINEFLGALDVPFIERLETEFKKPILAGDLVHLFMLGVRTEHSKRFIVKEMFNLLNKVAIEKGYKGIFAEATNNKSLKVFENMDDYIIPSDLSGRAITKKYVENEFFKTIPADIAEGCTIVYKSLNDENKLK
jgi:hypothetical protein